MAYTMYSGLFKRHARLFLSLTANTGDEEVVLREHDPDARAAKSTIHVRRKSFLPHDKYGYIHTYAHIY